jgi:hypothetical protein
MPEYEDIVVLIVLILSSKIFYLSVPKLESKEEHRLHEHKQGTQLSISIIRPCYP